MVTADSRNGACQDFSHLQKHNANATPLRLIRHVPLIRTTINRLRPPIVKVVMQLSITRPKLQLLQEQGVIMQRKRIEDIELCLRTALAFTLQVTTTRK